MHRWSLVPLLLLAISALTSCATKQPPPLLSDTTGKHDSNIPWNQQEKWESQGQFGPMAEKFEGNSNNR